ITSLSTRSATLWRDTCWEAFERLPFVRSRVVDFVPVVQPGWPQDGVVEPGCLDDAGGLAVGVENAAVMFTRDLVIYSHRADEDQALDAGLLHGLRDTLCLLLQIPGKISIYDILASHGRLQRLHVQNIALYHAHAVGMAG